MSSRFLSGQSGWNQSQRAGKLLINLKQALGPIDFACYDFFIPFSVAISVIFDFGGYDHDHTTRDIDSSLASAHV